MPKLSKRIIDGLEADGRDRDVYDDDLKGFGVRVRGSGRKTYFVMMRLNGTMRRFTIGAHGAITAEEARKTAKQIIADIAAGRNPTAERDRTRRSQTVKALGERFLKEYVPAHCKESTAAEYKRSVDIFIAPKIGARKVTVVQRTDIAELHHGLRKTPYQANRTLGVLSIMFTQAEAWNIRPEGSNPCRGVKRFKEDRRERFLSADELKKLGKALSEEEHEVPSAVACIRLLILTGCRLGEIQKLKWEYIDFDGKMIHLPDSKTGKKTLYLGQAAVDQLERIPRVKDNPYVITGQVEGQYLTDMQKPWRRIRKAAGLDDVRIHDLRHTFASNCVALGQGLPVIGKLLGHTQAQTTARYAHLAADPSLAAADKISASLVSALYGRNDAAA